jgi:hypothetical protein
MRRHWKSRGSRSSKSQENTSILSHSALCIAASLLRSTATNCEASNSN